MKKNIFIVALAFTVIILVANLFQNWFTLNKDERLAKETRQAQKSGKSIDELYPADIKINDRDSTTSAWKPIKESHSLSNALPSHTQEYINKEILPAIKATEKELIEFDKVKGVLSGEVAAANIQISPNKSVRIEYKNKYLSIVTEQDPTGKVLPAKYSYNAETTRARIGKKPILLFWEKEEIVDVWSSPDPNYRINGVEHYSQAVEVPKTIFQLKADAGFQLGFKNPNNTNLKAGVSAVFNADGFISPEIGVGKTWNLKDGTNDNYGQVRANFNIFKIRK